MKCKCGEEALCQMWTLESAAANQVNAGSNDKPWGLPAASWNAPRRKTTASSSTAKPCCSQKAAADLSATIHRRSGVCYATMEKKMIQNSGSEIYGRTILQLQHAT
jgi:hypothetical protein